MPDETPVVHEPGEREAVRLGGRPLEVKFSRRATGGDLISDRDRLVYGLPGYDFAGLDLALRYESVDAIGDPYVDSLAMSKPGLAIAEGVPPVQFTTNALQHNIAVSMPDPAFGAIGLREGDADIRYVAKDSTLSIDGVVIPAEGMTQRLDRVAMPCAELQDPAEAMRYAERTVEHLGRLGAARTGLFEDLVAYVQSMKDQGRYLNLRETADFARATYGAYADHVRAAYGVETPTPAHMVKLVFEMNRREQDEPTLYVYTDEFRARMAGITAAQTQ